MDGKLNPEKQLRNIDPVRGKFVSKWKYGVYNKVNNPAIKDIGRVWMNTTDYEKNTGFIEWRKK